MSHKYLCFFCTIFLLLIFPFIGHLHAQQWQDTLREVEIRNLRAADTGTDRRVEFTAGQSTVKIQHLYKDLYDMQSLANLLAQQSSVFVKSYGVNSMATLSLRGASAAQSSVLWNGVPVLNPALGVADLSILRTGLFHDITLQYGSSSALFGSGNVGGALMLDDGPASFYDRKNITLNMGYGSYGRLDGSIRALFQHKRIRIGLNGFYQKARNDFKYIDAQGLEQHLDHADMNGGGGLFTIDYSLDKKNDIPRQWLYLKVWLQQYDRSIPPALFEQYSEKQQQDRSLRTMLGWEKKGRKSTFYAKGSYSREHLSYQDVKRTENTVHQYYEEAGWRYTFGNPERTGETWQQQVMFYMPVQYARAAGNNIDGYYDQLRPALVAAYRFNTRRNRLALNAALRQEWVSGKAAPLLPGIGGAWDALHVTSSNDNTSLRLQLRANIQRTYRIPTLNELYYFPGGNPDLKPEQGWSQDGGYTAVLKAGLLPENGGRKSHASHRFVFTHEVNLFNRDIQDWIYWLGGAIWTPHNIARVHSRGLETLNKMELTTGNITFHLGAGYSYVLSTTEHSYLPGDGSIGKQIPYTPRYNVQGNIGLQWAGSLFVNYNQTYTGYRFVTTDESQYLEPYYTGNVQVNYTFMGKRKMLSLSAQAQNIFDTKYEVVNGRPMPGRNFLLQLKLGLF